MTVTRVSTFENMHPYACDTFYGGTCKHCVRRKTPDHDPATCPLCDLDYDLQPNWLSPAAEEKP